MNNQNFKIIVVTNQSGIARGRYTESAVQHLHQWVDTKLEEQNLNIDDWYYAAHHPEYDPQEKFSPGDRKPGTGMFKKAAAEHQIDFDRSYMAGDKITDLKPAITLGISPLFIRSRHEKNQEGAWLKKHQIPIFDNINQAVQAL